MLNPKRSSNLKVKDTVGIVELAIVLVILPIGIGYISASIFFRFAVWLSIIIGLASSIVIFLSLVFLLGATARFPDHLFGPENDSEI
jgi:predicted Na+-dependent transporter